MAPDLDDLTLVLLTYILWWLRCVAACKSSAMLSLFVSCPLIVLCVHPVLSRLLSQVKSQRIQGISSEDKNAFLCIDTAMYRYCRFGIVAPFLSPSEREV